MHLNGALQGKTLSSSFFWFLQPIVGDAARVPMRERDDSFDSAREGRGKGEGETGVL